MSTPRTISVTRRQWLGLAAAAAAGCSSGTPRPGVIGSGGPDAGDGGPGLTDAGSTQDVTGPDAVPADVPLPTITALDTAMTAHMTALGIPGGALAVVRNHRLVYAKGYGTQDPDAGAATQPDTLFRIASLSKQFTSAAVFTLVEAGRLDVNARALDLVGVAPFLPAGSSVDSRLAGVTVLQLLQHLGGWDRAVSPDPMFQSRAIAAALGQASPPGATDVVRYQLGRPLDFDPGSRYAYANFGYCVLGRIIEQVTGGTYAAYVQDHVLTPAGITRMRQGASLLTGRAPSEARYMMESPALAASVFDRAPGMVPWPYGGFDLEAMDSHGAWVASAVDLMRFAVAMDPTGPAPLLRASSLATMYALPPGPVWRNPDGSPMAAYYGCGWLVRPVAGGGANYWHDGSLPGNYSYVVRLANGISWAVLFNLRSDANSNANGAIDGQMNAAIASVTEWPADDLFSRFG